MTVTPSPQSVVVPVERLSANRERFNEALGRVPDVADRRNKGQQFNAYDLDDEGDEPERKAVCIGPITSRPLSLVEAPADVADLIEAALRLASDSLLAAAPAPSSLAGGDVDDRLSGAIGKLKAWVDLIQQGKRGEAVSGNPIVDCVNDLPAIVRELEAAELEIEGAFERYEDAALSPEAPARVVGTIAHVSHGRSELSAQIAAALTPRHEAPASAIDDLVDRFAVALKEKLHAAEAKYGHDDAWLRDDWRDDLIRQLGEHVQKGDPRDVAAYCAFAWNHGWSVGPFSPLTENDEAPAEGAGELIATIRTRLIGVSPDDQDVVLEDSDWLMIVAALEVAK